MRFKTYTTSFSFFGYDKNGRSSYSPSGVTASAGSLTSHIKNSRANIYKKGLNMFEQGCPGNTQCDIVLTIITNEKSKFYNFQKTLLHILQNYKPKVEVTENTV